MKIYKLKPAVKDYIWGGTKLKEEWNKVSDTEKISETWELSFHPDGPSAISGGKDSGKHLKDVVGIGEIGKNAERFPFFPILIKLIDAKENLSVQVHPQDGYALKNENSLGKTEMWYIAACDKGAGIYCGFNREIDREEFKDRILDGTLLEVLKFFEVKSGECFYIPAGTIHAIGKGVTICEIQESSNLTYRVFDYNRIDKDGKPRPLHIEKAIEVADLSIYKDKVTPERIDENLSLLKRCEYFTVFSGSIEEKLFLTAGPDSFNCILFLEGEGSIEGQRFIKGDTFFVPAGYGAYEISGKCRFLLSKV